MGSTNEISFYTIDNIEIIEAVGMHVFPFHSHLSYIVGIVLNGSALFNIGGKEKVLKKNDCYCVPSNIGISITPINDFSYLSVCFKKELAFYLNDYSLDNYYVCNSKDQIYPLICNFKILKIKEKELIEAIIQLFKMEQSIEKKKIEYIEKATEYIYNHSNEKFVLDELSDYLALSKYHLTRLFKAYTGITPKQYHEQCRLRKIKEMVLDNSQSNIAYSLKFTSQSHMESIFKKYMGLTLKEYRTGIKNPQ